MIFRVFILVLYIDSTFHKIRQLVGLDKIYSFCCRCYYHTIRHKLTVVIIVIDYFLNKTYIIDINDI